MIENLARKSWWQRHLIVIMLSAVVTIVVYNSRAEWSAMHRWNRAVGDASLIMIAMAMAIGPLSRLSRSFARLTPYRREIGIYAILLALIHAIIILFGWVTLDLMRLFGFEFHPGLQQYVMVNQGFAFANAIGLVGLVYGIILAVTSNDASMRWLGNSVWKFIQQGTYVLWWLSVMHTAYFLFLHFLDYHRQTPEPNWAQWPFVALVGVVLTLQIVASWTTWRKGRDRGAVASGAS